MTLHLATFQASRLDPMLHRWWRLSVLPVVALAWLLLMADSATAAEVQLPRIFSDNLVLQSNCVNVLWGQAPPREYVEIRYKNRIWTGRAGKDGDWRIELDVNPNLDSEPSPLQIVLGRKPNLRLGIALTNVAVGEVYLVGVSRNGVPIPMELAAPPSDQGRRHPGTFHVLSGFRLDSLTNSLTATNTGWSVWSPSDTSPQPLDALSFYWARQIKALRPLTREHIGIIEIAAEDLAAVPPPANFVRRVDKLRAGHYRELVSLTDSAFSQAAAVAVQVEAENRREIIRAKHEGRVVQPRGFATYGPPHVYLREAFAERPALNLLSFDAAVW